MSWTTAALVRALRALGDVTRFRMVQEIAAGGELCCGEVAERFDVTQPTISHHLKVLCVAGVLLVRSQGKHRYISVNQPLLSNLATRCRSGSCRRRGRRSCGRKMTRALRGRRTTRVSRRKTADRLVGSTETGRIGAVVRQPLAHDVT